MAVAARPVALGVPPQAGLLPSAGPELGQWRGSCELGWDGLQTTGRPCASPANPGPPAPRRQTPAPRASPADFGFPLHLACPLQAAGWARPAHRALRPARPGRGLLSGSPSPRRDTGLSRAGLGGGPGGAGAVGPLLSPQGPLMPPPSI